MTSSWSRRPVPSLQPLITVLLLFVATNFYNCNHNCSCNLARATATKNEETSHGKLPTHMEPDVRRYQGVLPNEICDQLIELGEKEGFPLEFDSIDAEQHSYKTNQVSQAIDVVDEDGTVNYPEMFALLEPYIPKMAELIVNQRDEQIHRKVVGEMTQQTPSDDSNDPFLPKLGWIFYRKYAPDSKRNSLIPHFDSNLHTINIALNDDFEGGGVFYIRPAYARNPDWRDPKRHNDLYRGIDGDGVPDIEDHQLTYRWVNRLKHENTSDVVFPLLNKGDAVIHNYTVWHAVAPLTKGIRYSMVLFFDMHNPLLPEYSYDDDDEYDGDDHESQNEGQDDDDNGYDSGIEEDHSEDNIYRMQITLRHGLKECDPAIGTVVPMKDNVHIVLVNRTELERQKGEQTEHDVDKIMVGKISDGDGESSSQNDLFAVVATNLRPGNFYRNNLSVPGEIYRAIRSKRLTTTEGSNIQNKEHGGSEVFEVLDEFRVTIGKRYYEYANSEEASEECKAAHLASSIGTAGHSPERDSDAKQGSTNEL